MDETLVKEIENVIKIEDEIYKKKSFIKIINYLMTFKDLSFIMNSDYDAKDYSKNNRASQDERMVNSLHTNKELSDNSKLESTFAQSNQQYNDLAYQKRLLKKFLETAIEILPSSSLPLQLSKKLNINFKRARVVSFSNSSVSKIKDEVLSPEAMAQDSREKGVLCINNTDINRKYTPKIQYISLKERNTLKFNLELTLLENTLAYKPTSSRFLYKSPEFNVDKCIDDLSYIKEVIKNIGCKE